ncbi:MAG: hypothetical protein KKB29_00180, partial [Nanoarchaeota archaeon]|nr:hypothetical protein [Nanoarchaeota archaeon]
SRKKEDEKDRTLNGSLTELPRLPDFSEDDNFGPIHKLPSMPNSSLGTKFSQDTIKEAVAGEKEDREFPDADDFDDESENFDEDSDEMRMMQEPLRKPLTKELWKNSGSGGFDSGRNVGEPVFIRIDNFEEALKIFNNTKKKISDIEHTLSEIKKLKEREEGELKSWENEIRSMKDQIEKADRDIFSKI